VLFCYLFYFQDFHGCFSSVIGKTTIICFSGQIADDDNLLTIVRERAGCAFFRVHFARGSMLISTVRPSPPLALAMIDLQRRRLRDKLRMAWSSVPMAGSTSRPWRRTPSRRSFPGGRPGSSRRIRSWHGPTASLSAPTAASTSPPRRSTADRIRLTHTASSGSAEATKCLGTRGLRDQPGHDP